MKIAIIQFPGAVGSYEVKRSLWRVGIESTDFFWHESTCKLNKYAGFIVLGGETAQGSFHLSAMAARSLMMNKIKEYANAGKIVLGVGVGAQILLEAGLIINNPLHCVLGQNKRVYFDKIIHQGFSCVNTYVRLNEKAKSPIFNTNISRNTIFPLLLKQSESRFILSSTLAEELEEEGLVVFQYCDEVGRVVDEFPINPNASTKNIAALSNYAGNVLAIVPHPESHVQGDIIFSALRDFVEEKESLRLGQFSVKTEDLNRIQEVEHVTKTYKMHKRFFVSPWLEQETQVIQQWLNQHALTVNIQRFFYWAIECSSKTLKKIERTEVLRYPQNAEPLPLSFFDDAVGQAFLVYEKDDIRGDFKRQLLMNHFEIDGIQCVRSGILWHFETKDNLLIEKIISMGIVFNPAIHRCRVF